MHTAVFTERSGFFRASRKPEWLAGDSKKPVDLKDEEPEVFNTYINCVYFGQNALKHYEDGIKSSPASESQAAASAGFRALIQVYLLADKLQDPTTATIAIDEIIQFSDAADLVPNGMYSLVYSHTPRNCPLRTLMRDFWIYELDPSTKEPLEVLPRELMEDIMTEFLRVKDKHEGSTVREAFRRTLSADTKKDKCRYHQHDDKHPRCAPESKSG